VRSKNLEKEKIAALICFKLFDQLVQHSPKVRLFAFRDQRLLENNLINNDIDVGAVKWVTKVVMRRGGVLDKEDDVYGVHLERQLTEEASRNWDRDRDMPKHCTLANRSHDWPCLCPRDPPLAL